MPDKYEFGYNGQMKMNEIAGTGNWNTAQFWEYQTRFGHRENPDPKGNASMSPYAVFGVNPILHADPLGDTIDVRGFVTKWDGRGNVIATENVEGALQLWNETLEYLKLNGMADDAEALIKSPNHYDLFFYTNQHQRMAGPEFKPYFNGNNLKYNHTPALFLSPSYALKTTNGYLMSPIEITVHELAHGSEHDKNPCQAWLDAMPGSSTEYGSIAEQIVITNQEQKAARRLAGMPSDQVTRKDHNGTLVPTKHWWPGESNQSPRERREKKPNTPSKEKDSGNYGPGAVLIQIGDKIEVYGGKK